MLFNYTGDILGCMTNETKEGSKKPKTNQNGTNSELAHTVRDGSVAANIWRRQSQTGYPYYDFSLSRSYKSVSTGKEGYSQNYFGKNEAQLMKVIQGATEWIAKAESQDQSDNAGALAA